MTKGYMSDASTHLITNIKECYGKVLAQPKSITDILLEGRYVDWDRFDLKTWNSKLDYVKAVLNTTSATKDIGNRLICSVGIVNEKPAQWALASV